MKPLSKLEERCFAIITLEAITGDETLPEGGARPLPAPKPKETPSAALGKAPAESLELGNVPIIIIEQEQAIDEAVLFAPDVIADWHVSYSAYYYAFTIQEVGITALSF